MEYKYFVCFHVSDNTQKGEVICPTCYEIDRDRSDSLWVYVVRRYATGDEKCADCDCYIVPDNAD